jgi:hypothetical protein
VLELWRLRVLTELDVRMFAVYCWAAATWATAVKVLNEVAERDPVMNGVLVPLRRCSRLRLNSA